MNERCENCGLERESSVHISSNDCGVLCQNPRDHHDFVKPKKFSMTYTELLAALNDTLKIDGLDNAILMFKIVAHVRKNRS